MSYEPRYTGTCSLTPNLDGKTWTVNNDFVFSIGGGKDISDITVLKGETTDLATIPNLGLIGATVMLLSGLSRRFLDFKDFYYGIVTGYCIALSSSRFKPFGKHTRAAIVHDHLYVHNTLPRPMCDSIFHAAMRADGVGPVTAAVMYVAVRLCGWRAFYRKRKEQRARKTAVMKPMQFNERKP